MSRSVSWLLAVLLAVPVIAACAPPATSSLPAAPASVEASSSTVPAPAASATAAPRERLRAIYPAPSLTHSHMFVAQEAGYYTAEGLDVDLQYLTGATLMVSAMIAGEVDIASLTAGPAIAAGLQGADLVTIAEPFDRLSMSLYAVPEIRSAEALRGKRMGVVIPGGVTDMAARHALRHLGLEPDRDMIFVRTGGLPETYTAMISGATDAGMLSHPVTVQGYRGGLVELLDLSKLDLEYPTAGVVTTQRLLAAREDAALRFLRATWQAIHRMKTDKEFTLSVLARFTGLDDREVLEEGYRTTMPLYREVPVPTRSGTLALMEEVAYTQPAIRELDPSRFYEPRLVQRLEAEGFYRQLWGR